MTVPEERVGKRGDQCPLCLNRVPSEALDDAGRHKPGCTWRADVERQRNLRFYGVEDPFMVENGKGRVKVTVTFELDVEFVSDLALSTTLKNDFTNPDRAIPLGVHGAIVSWRRRGGNVDRVEWVNRTEPKERTR